MNKLHPDQKEITEFLNRIRVNWYISYSTEPPHISVTHLGLPALLKRAAKADRVLTRLGFTLEDLE